MARIIMKQPNNKFAIWSTIVDNFIIKNGTKDDVISLCIEYYRKRYKDDVSSMIKEINKIDKEDGFDDYKYYCDLLSEFE